MLAATHSTASWYFVLIPIAMIGARLLFRRGGGRGPFGGRGRTRPFGGRGGTGPFGGGGGTGSSGPGTTI